MSQRGTDSKNREHKREAKHNWQTVIFEQSHSAHRDF